MSLATGTVDAYTRMGMRIDRDLMAGGLAPTPSNYVMVMTVRRGALAQSTWRFMRAAVKWWIGYNQGEEAAARFTVEFPTARPDPAPRRRYPKQLPPTVASALIGILRSGRKGKNKRLAADMIEAGIAIGLRPCEWSNVRRKENTLIVKNAKYREGVSGNGKYRELELDDNRLTASEKAAMERVIAEMQGVEWRKIGGNVRRALNVAKSTLLKHGIITPKQARTRIYEARHQFAANAKRDLRYVDGEVAAVMGQRSAVTARVNYGNRSKAKGTLPVKPSQKSLAAVSKRSIERLQRMLERVNFFSGERMGVSDSRAGAERAAGKSAEAATIMIEPYRRE